MNKRILFFFRTIFIVFSLILLTHLSMAQNKTTVSGRIFDGQTNEPLPFATIVLNSKTGNMFVTGTISGEDGRFTFSGISKGEYNVIVSFVGYTEKEFPLLVGELNNIFDLGKISVFPSSEQIGEVIVEAKREIISGNLDKKSYQVEENLAQAGGSVLDVMKSMPGITVDQEGKVLLRGSDKVAILMDGKQSSLTGFGNQKGLDNLPAANIESIEIINNPSAKYDAAGMAGIINIIYKKGRKSGFTGDSGLSLGWGVLSKSKTDLPTKLGSYSMNPKMIPNLNFNFKNDRINVFLQSEVLQQKALPNNEFTTRIYQDGTRNISQVPENRTQTHVILKSGIDWFVDEANLITVSGIYDWEIHNDTAQVPYLSLPGWKRYRYWHWNEREITGYMNYALRYKHKFAEPGHELNGSLQYTKGWEDESYFMNDSSAIRTGTDNTHILATEHTTNLTVDYVKPLRSGRIETGTKLQWRRLPVEYTIEKGANSVIYPGMGSWSDWGEDIYAGYANYVLEKPKFDVEAGLRAEQTYVFYTISPENIYYQKNDSYNYFEFFPNVRITLKINPSNGISVFFNRRIDRPGEPELRIFPKYDDPELLKVGNPYLRPQITTAMELAYKTKWGNGSFFLSGYYRFIDDAYQRIYSIDNSNNLYAIVNKIYQNTGRATNKGFEAIFSQQIAKPWKVSGSLNWYTNHIDQYTGTVLFPYQRPYTIDASKDNTWDFKLNNQITLPGKTQVQVTGVYYAPKNIPQGRQLSRSSVDIGAKKSILSGKSELIFSFSDIFNQFGIRQEVSGDGFEALYENDYETQVVRIGFRCEF